jgi:hypothetical protein
MLDQVKAGVRWALRLALCNVSIPCAEAAASTTGVILAGPRRARVLCLNEAGAGFGRNFRGAHPCTAQVPGCADGRHDFLKDVATPGACIGAIVASMWHQSRVSCSSAHKVPPGVVPGFGIALPSSCPFPDFRIGVA